MNHDAKRATGPGAGGERHAIGVTRMCLRSGSVQLPFALAGRLPEGELLVHDVESDEALVLWSEPPRRLAGLGPLFERYEVQVNDQLVLDLHGDDIRLAVAKRPRRSRPKVTPSTWASHRDEPPRPAPAATEGPDDSDDAAPDGEHPAAGGHRATFRPDADRHGVDADVPTPPDAATDARTDEPSNRRARESEPQPRDPGTRERFPTPDDDAPRAPRVRVKPLAPAASPGGGEAGAPEGDVAMPRERRGPLAGLVRAARGWLGGGERRRRRDAPAPADDEEPDWTDAWQGLDADDDGGAEASFAAARYVEEEPERDPPPARRRRGPVARDVARDVAVPPAAGTFGSEAFEPEAFETRTLDPDALDPRPTEAGAPGGVASRRAAPPHDAAPDDAAPDDRAPDDAAPDDPVPDDGATTPRDVESASSGPTLPSGVPLRAERFLGGDLRTRLLRFLASPDMPLIAKTELIAKRFDLDLDTARDMLEDVADDPPDGLRLTPVRDGAWRIERTGS